MSCKLQAFRPLPAGVVLLGRLDGKLEAWDLLDRAHGPVAVAPVTPAPILALAFSPGIAGAASRAHAHVREDGTCAAAQRRGTTRRC